MVVPLSLRSNHVATLVKYTPWTSLGERDEQGQLDSTVDPRCSVARKGRIVLCWEEECVKGKEC